MLKNYSLLMIFAFATILTACKEDTTVPKSSAKAITKFTFSQFNPAVQATIDESTKRITAVVPSTADVSKLIPSISVSLKAKVLPDSGKVQDFTNEVTYSVTAEDGTKVDYKVMVSRTKFSGKDITEFSFADFSPAIVAKIDPTTKTITATVPATADLTKLKPTLKLSDRATVNPVSGTVVDFSKAVNFTVTAEDAGTQVYAVTVVKEVKGGGGTVFYTDLFGGITGLDIQTGQKVWEWSATAINNIQACSSPTISDNVMYIGIGLEFFAIDIKTQKTKWTTGYSKSRYYSCPTVSNGIVYTDNGKSLLALDTQSGKLIWSVDIGKFKLSSPTVDNGVVYIGSDDGNVYAFEAKTGKQKWKYSLYFAGETFTDIYGNPSVVDGIVYANPSSSSSFSTAIDATTGKKIWDINAGGASSEASPTVANGIVYFFLTSTHALAAFDAKTGAKLWQFNKSTDTSSPMVVNGIIYFVVKNINALDAKTGTVKADFITTETSNIPILATEQLLFIGNSGGAKAIDSQTGKLLWTNKLVTGFSYPTTPIILNKDGTVIHGGVSGMTN